MSLISLKLLVFKIGTVCDLCDVGTKRVDVIWMSCVACVGWKMTVTGVLEMVSEQTVRMRDSSVRIVNRLLTGRRENHVRVTERSDFSLFHLFLTGFLLQPATYSVGTRTHSWAGIA